MAELTLNPRDITEALRRNLAGWSPSLEAATVGEVISIGDGVARVAGLPGCMASELLEFPGGLLGVALNLDEDSIGAVVIPSFPFRLTMKQVIPWYFFVLSV